MKQAMRITALVLAAGGVAGGCKDPMAVFRERDGDLAPRLPADRLTRATPMGLEGFKRAEAPMGDALETIKQRQALPRVEWSLQDVRARAVAENLDLKVALVDPQIAEQALAIERAKFDAVFTPSVRYRNDDQPTLNTTTSSQSQSVSASGALTIPLRTGGRATVALSENFQQTNNPFVVFNQSYGTGLDASVSIPLLRGYGRAVNTASIKIAGYQADVASAGTKLQVINILAAAERAYWRLVGARQELEVRQKQYELAQAQVERAKRRVAAGDAAQIEITRAESGLAQQVEAILTAETNVLTTQRELKRLVNANPPPRRGGAGGGVFGSHANQQTENSDAGASSSAVGDREPHPLPLPSGEGSGVDDATLVIPTDAPVSQRYELPAEQLVTLAEANRMDLLQTELQLLADALNIELAIDGTQPKLNLDAGYSFDGLGTGLDGSVHSLVRRRWQSWNVALSGEMPIGNEAAEANLRRAVLTRVQRLGSLEARCATIRQEVLDAIDRAGSAWQRILAAQQSAVLAGKTLESESRQFDAGSRTSTDVLDAAARLADAQSAEVRALADYRTSLVDLAAATGTVLGSSDVTWEMVPAPGLEGERPWGLRPGN